MQYKEKVCSTPRADRRRKLGEAQDVEHQATAVEEIDVQFVILCCQ